MDLRACLLTALALAAPAACSAPAPGPTPFAHAAYHDDCAPWDGPAVTLYLSHEAMAEPHAPPRPHVSVALYSSLTSLVGSTLRWEGRDDQRGHVSRCPDQGDCQEASAVWIRLASPGSDGLLEGEVRLDFGAGDVVEGSFEAVRIPFERLCG